MGIHMIPRSDGVVLGGTSEAGDRRLGDDEEARRQIVEGDLELFQSMDA